MPYELPPLPYDYDALAPTIDEQTMRIHHDKHHQAYVTNVNAALEGTEWADRPIEQVLDNLDLLPEDKRAAVRNNGGGHANHSLFWQIMGPNGGGAPSGALAAAIDATFESLDALKAQVVDAGVKRFGSGWSWLIHDGTGLAVVSTPNQDTPLMTGDTPLLGVDVWEHAYYLNYQNRRPDYLAAWWDVVNWDEVGRRYERGRLEQNRSRWSRRGSPSPLRALHQKRSVATSRCSSTSPTKLIVPRQSTTPDVWSASGSTSWTLCQSQAPRRREVEIRLAGGGGDEARRAERGETPRGILDVGKRGDHQGRFLQVPREPTREPPRRPPD